MSLMVAQSAFSMTTMKMWSKVGTEPAARADAGGVVPCVEPVELASLVGEVRETLLVLAEEKQQRIDVTAPPLALRADRELLRLALMNLVHNAIRYSPAGGVIGLRVGRRASHAGFRSRSPA